MTVLDAATPPDAAGVEAPSGKWRGDENFPVGSWLIRRDLRVHVHAFYRFARNADDIADSPTLAAEDKVRRLDRMATILDGGSGSESPAATAMRESLAATGVTAQHCHDVLQAFRLDVTKLRYRDWDDLMEYCRYSASPVGRQLLDLHAAGGGVEVLAAPAASPGLRRVLDTMLDRTERLIATARSLPPRVAARGLRWESAVIVGLAERLARRLRRGDPLATRVALTKSDIAAAFLRGILARRQQ